MAPKFLFYLLVCFVIICNCCCQKKAFTQWPSLRNLRSSTPSSIQEITVRKMLGRLLPPQQSDNFVIVVNPSLIYQDRDVFVLRNDRDGRRIQIHGSSGVAAALGFQYFAKKFCNCHFSWSGNQVDTMPITLPRLRKPIRVVTRDLFRYYQNAVTFSYSFVWWNWTRWEHEIDWMALNGINLALAFTGQEEIYRRVYSGMGLQKEDLDTFFTGPAFLAWGRMGNIDGWGGPLPTNWYQQQLDLQHQILKRMRNFGITPVLPSFSGHVPKTFQTYFPQAEVTHLPQWGHFNETYCCTSLLNFSNPLFQTVGQRFLLEMQQEFGLDHVYSSDTFNEMAPSTSDPDYVASAGQALFQIMQSVDPSAVWIMQGWLFLEPFWNATMASALLLSVPKGRLLVLDLQAELQPQYQRLHSYFGQPWIWCMLHNFGGIQGLYGIVNNITQGPFDGRKFPNSTMVGLGITAEGIEQNDVIYELMNDMAIASIPINTKVWFNKYPIRRYGVKNSNVTSAWQVLRRTAYNCPTGRVFHGQFTFKRPSLKLSPYMCYNVSDFLPSWDFMMAASSSPLVSQSDLFQHDLVDVTREALVAISSSVYYEMCEAYFVRNVKVFQQSSLRLLDLLQDLDDLLGSDPHFLLGPWIQSAKLLATSEQEARLYEYNARSQITLWGPTGEHLDYAAKQWSGLILDYYLPRWNLFAKEVLGHLRNGTSFNSKKFNSKVFQMIESPFTFSQKIFPVTPRGDPVKIAQAVYNKWRPRAFPPPNLNIRV